MARLQGVLDDEARPTTSKEFWHHEDFIIYLPASFTAPSDEQLLREARLHFDGGCRVKEKLGSGGFIGWLPSGECWGGAG